MTVPIANLELDENIGFAHPSSSSPFDAQHASGAGSRRVGHLQIASRAPTGEPGAPAPTWCSPALRETPQTGSGRSTPLGMAVCGLERLAVCSDHRQTGHRHRLPPRGLSSVLDLEGPPRPTGAAGGSETRPGADPAAESRIRCGAPVAFTANSSSSASISAEPASASISCAIASLHRRLGEPSSRTTSRPWSRWNSFPVPAVTFQVLYVFLVLAHDRRIVHFNVTAHPTAEWTAQQLREAFPFDQVPRYLLRDRDGHLWQRVSRRRERHGNQGGSFDSPVVLGTCVCGTRHRHNPKRMPRSRDRLQPSLFVPAREAYDHESRTHLSLVKDAPEPGPVHPPQLGAIIALPQVGGLHHRYERRAA